MHSVKRIVYSVKRIECYVIRGFSLGSYKTKGEKGERDIGTTDKGMKGQKGKSLNIIEVLCCILGTCTFLFFMNPDLGENHLLSKHYFIESKFKVKTIPCENCPNPDLG